MRLLVLAMAMLLAAVSTARAEQHAEWATFRDRNCAIELRYPTDHLLNATSAPEYCALWISLRAAVKPETSGSYEVSIEEMNSAEREAMTQAHVELTARGFALWKTELHCAADGPDGSTYCTDARVRRTFKTTQGYLGFDIETTEITSSYEEGADAKVDKRAKAPIYVLDLSDDGVIRILLAEPMQGGRPETLRAVLDTLRVWGKARRYVPKVIQLQSPGRLLVPQIGVPSAPK